MTQSAKLQSYIRENVRSKAEAQSVPPFTLFLQPADRSERANIAIPDEPVAGDIREALDKIELICATRKCKAHFLFLRAFSPNLASVLQASGYGEAESLPLLFCTPQTLRPAEPVAGLEMVTLSSDSSLPELKEGLDANALGFDMLATLATDEEAEAFRPNLNGCLAFIARLQGHTAGGGMFNPIRHGVTELAGVATLPAFRRRGIAAFLSAFATQAAFELGAETVFLIPENAEAQRVYERIGYTFYSDLLRYHAKKSSQS